MDVDSPCIRNCCLDNDDVCVGCFRSIDEITRWSQSSSQEKTKILLEARKRKEKRKENHSL